MTVLWPKIANDRRNQPIVLARGRTHKRSDQRTTDGIIDMAAKAGDHGAAPTGAQAFADALFATALPGEADAIDAAAAERIVAMVAAAAAQRTPGNPEIAIEPIDNVAGKRRLALVIVNDDMPFLVDSVSAAITHAGLGIDRLLHPVVDVRRSAAGRLETLAPAEGGAPPPGGMRESMIYIELERVGARARGALVEQLRGVLSDVRNAVTDWQPMLGALRDATRALAENPPPVAPHAAAETTAFLDWLAADNFTLLGVRRTDLTNGSATGLGLLRDPDFTVWGADDARPALDSPEPLIVSKAAAQSTVHRPVNFDMISVKGYDRAGRTTSETRFIGLFTSSALATSPRSVPLLRRKVGAVIDSLGFDPRGHTGKALVHVLETFPREELFEVSPERLEVMALGLLSLLDRPRPKLFARADAFGRFVSVLVYVPREAYTGGVRERVGTMLTSAFKGTLTRYEVELRAEGLARVHYIVATPDGVPDIDEPALDARLDAMVRGWEEAVETALVDIAGPVRAARLSLTHGKCFSTSYRAQYSAAEAAADIIALSKLDDAAGREVLLYRRDDDRPEQLRLKIYRLGQIIPLSDAVPVLENFGLRVIEEFPFDLDGGKHGWIHDFLLEVQGDGPAPDLDVIRDRVEAALRQVLLGAQENDAFNALVIGCGLDSETTGWLRAYFRYLRQTGIAYGLTTVVDALRRYPALTNDIVALFRARFGLAIADRDAAVAAIAARIHDGLGDVKAIDDDQILQLYRAVIAATLRTNAFVPGRPEALAFKLDSRAVPNLPPPVPYREIWVYSPRVEGIHLRGGPIARGGLRWSDRREDFRTEVLGLMKAQMVKNAPSSSRSAPRAASYVKAATRRLRRP